MDEDEKQPSQNVENLARHAISAGKMAFRIAACKPENFDAALAAELLGDGKKSFHALTKAERIYVLNWIQFHMDEYIKDGQPDDQKLIAAINRKLAEANGGVGIATG